jgi:hypothetical protein
MKVYKIQRDIIYAEGYQTWEISANSKEEAFEKYKKGECVMTESECEVIRLSDYDINDFEETT